MLLVHGPIFADRLHIPGEPVLYDRSSYVSSDRFTPPWHLLAVEYMRVFPGTPYARACDIVKGESGADPWATPWYHQAAVGYMMDRPGLTYEAAVEHVTAGKTPTPDPPEDDPFAEPLHHKTAVAYMLSRPGTTYESAVEYVRGRR